jgi:hypothetical protein
VAEGHLGVAGQARADSGDLDQGNLQVDGRPLDPEVRDRQLFLEVRGEDDDRPGRVAVGQEGPGHPVHHLGRQPVTELAVDVVGLEHALGQAGPGVGVLVGAAGAADDGHRRRTSPVDGAGQAGGGGVERFGPARLGPGAVDSPDLGLDDAIGVVHVVEGEPPLVAQPAVVEGFGIDAEHADQPICR